MTTANTFNLVTLYKEYFGRGSYHIDNDNQTSVAENILYSGIPKNPRPRGTIHKSKFNQDFNKIGAYGQDIWFPIKLQGFQMLYSQPTIHTLEIDACTVSVSMKTNIVRTPIVLRKGCVHEIVNIDDYQFTIRGFLIGKNRTVPENEIEKLKYFSESLYPVELHGGYVELFLLKSCRVQIESVEFPEVQGQNHWIRPFTLICSSDFVEDMEF